MEKIKYKVSQLAKDMGMTGKVLVELLKKNGVPDKKYTTTTSLEGDELDLAYELITKEHAVASFDDFLSQAKRMEVSEVTEAEIEETKQARAKAEAAAKTEEEKAVPPEGEHKAEAKKPKEEKTDKPAAKEKQPVKVAAEKKPVKVKSEKTEKAEKTEKTEKAEKKTEPVKAEIKVEAKPKKDKPEVKPEVRPEVKPEVRSAAKPEQKKEPVRAEVKEPVKESSKPEKPAVQVKTPVSPAGQRAAVIGQIQIKPQQRNEKKKDNKDVGRDRGNRERKISAQDGQRRDRVQQPARQQPAQPQSGAKSAPTPAKVQPSAVKPAAKVPVKAATNKPIDPTFRQPQTPAPPISTRINTTHAMTTWRWKRNSDDAMRALPTSRSSIRSRRITARKRARKRKPKPSVCAVLKRNARASPSQLPFPTKLPSENLPSD